VRRFRAAARNFRIGFESRNAPGGAHQGCREQRKETNIRANVVHRHSRSQILVQHVLHFRLDIAMEIIAARAGI
jgi:hypothetical protein